MSLFQLALFVCVFISLLGLLIIVWADYREGKILDEFAEILSQRGDHLSVRDDLGSVLDQDWALGGTEQLFSDTDLGLRERPQRGKTSDNGA